MNEILNATYWVIGSWVVLALVNLTVVFTIRKAFKELQEKTNKHTVIYEENNELKTKKISNAQYQLLNSELTNDPASATVLNELIKSL